MSKGPLKISILALAVSIVSLGLSVYTVLKKSEQPENPAVSAVDDRSDLVGLIRDSSKSVVSIVARDKDFDNYAHLFLDQVEPAVGTGFVVDPGNLVVTNEHVVFDTYQDYFVVLSDGTYIKVKSINRDKQQDIAVLHVDDLNVSGLSLADSDKVEVGQRVVAIGNATGRLPNSVTTGIVSGLGRVVWAGAVDSLGFGGSKFTNLIQTDAAINPGNSGGPLINMEGKVIGVNVAKSWSENTGFAIPANNLIAILKSVKETGVISKAYLGVKSTFGESSVLNSTGKYDEYSGESVEAVEKDSPADKGGLKKYDMILKLDGQELSPGYSLTDALSDKKAKETVILEVLRTGVQSEVLYINVTLGEKLF